MNQDIYVVIEHLQGQIADISYIELAAARDLAQETGGSPAAGLVLHGNIHIATVTSSPSTQQPGAHLQYAV